MLIFSQVSALSEYLHLKRYLPGVVYADPGYSAMHFQDAESQVSVINWRNGCGRSTVSGR